MWGARTGQGRRPDGKWTSPTIEVRGRELLRLSALRTQPNRNRRSAAAGRLAGSCHDTIARCPPYGLLTTPLLSLIIDHTVRGRSVSFSRRLKTSYSIFTDSSLLTICEVRYSRHSMKRYDKCNVKFILKYNLILLLNGLLNVQYLCFYN